MFGCVLQIGIGSPSAECLRMAEPWHRSYCDRHGLSYVASYAPILDETGHRICFEKEAQARVLLETLEPDAVLIVMDGDDCLIQCTDKNLADALNPNADVAMLKQSARACHQAGVIWLRNTLKTREFLEFVVSRRHMETHPFMPEERVIANAIQCVSGLRVQPVGMEWHGFDEKSVVKHMLNRKGDKLGRMKVELKRLV